MPSATSNTKEFKNPMHGLHAAAPASKAPAESAVNPLQKLSAEIKELTHVVAHTAVDAFYASKGGYKAQCEAMRPDIEAEVKRLTAKKGYPEGVVASYQEGVADTLISVCKKSENGIMKIQQMSEELTSEGRNSAHPLMKKWVGGRRTRKQKRRKARGTTRQHK